MPTVRTYQRQVTAERAPTVRREEYRIAQLQTPAPAVPKTGVLEGMARFGETAANIGEQLYAAQQRKQDEIRLLDADRQAGDLENQLLFDPKTGALNVKGQGAIGLPDTVGKSWDDQMGKVRQSLSNDRQRLAFDQQTTARRTRLMDRLSLHINREMETVEAEAVNANVENESQAAIGDAYNPRRVNEALDKITKIYQDHAVNFDGTPRYPKEMTDAAIAKAHSRIQAGVIDRMLHDGNDIQAKVYYDHVEKQILGADRGHIEGALREGSQRGESLRVADTVTQKAGPDSTLSGLLEDVRKYTKDPETIDRADTRIKSFFAAKQEDERIATEKRNQTIREQLEAERARKEQEKAQHEQLVNVTVPNLIDQGKPKPEKVKTFLDGIDPHLWADQPQKVREEWERYAKRQEKGETVKTDLKLYGDLITESSDPQLRDKFLKTDLNDPYYLNHLAPADWKHVLNVREELRKGDQKKATEMTRGFLTVKETVNNTLGQVLGHKPDPKNKDEYGMQTELERLVNLDVADFEERNNKKRPDPREIQLMIDRHLTKGQPGEWFGFLHGTPFFDTAAKVADQPMHLTIDQIPPAEIPKIEAALMRKAIRENVPPEISPQMIIDAYQQKFRRPGR